MTTSSQESRAIAGGDAQRALSPASTDQAAARRNADEHEAEVRSVAVLGYN